MVFEGENAMQVMIHHAHAEPRRPSERIGVPIPAGLEELVMECLRKDPARRPAGAEILGDRLNAVPLPTPWTAERAEQWWVQYRPRPQDARPVADVLLSHEGRELRIGPHVRAGLARPTTRTPRIRLAALPSIVPVPGSTTSSTAGPPGKPTGVCRKA